MVFSYFSGSFCYHEMGADRALPEFRIPRGGADLPFHSARYVLFLAAAACIHALLPPRRRNLFLLAASWGFYAPCSLRFLPLLLLSVLANYALALGMERRPSKKGLYLALGLCADLGALFLCKYLGFFAQLSAALAYSLQIYCDFSAYSDMAVGSALLFGIRLPENFDAPYLARSIRDFWRRWHISLSSWFRDNLYIPLGGSRRGRLRAWFNVLVVFAVSGLWHGAALTFLLWGLLNGAYQVLEGLLARVRALEGTRVLDGNAVFDSPGLWRERSEYLRALEAQPLEQWKPKES
jgi:D-alanyl-lipoteichoic acid acyltransferase DltB (MBOAT superfamily)